MKAIDKSDAYALLINTEKGIIEHHKHIVEYTIEGW